MASAIKTTALITNLGAYYQEHRDEIMGDILLGLQPLFDSMGVVLWDGVADEIPLLNNVMGNVLQPGGAPETTNFTNDILTMDNRVLKVRPVKFDLKFVPQDFERQWITYNRTKKATMKEWVDIPFHAYFIQEIVAKIKEELFYASWTAKMANATTTFTSIIDGWVTLLKADVAASKVSQVGSGNAIVAGNVITELEAIADGISDAQASETSYMYVSPTVAKWYVRADTSVIGRGGVDFNGIAHLMNGQGFPEIYLRGANVKICPTPGLSKSATGFANESVIVSRKGNMVVGTDSMNEINEIDFQKFERTIKAFGDFKWGVNYRNANTAKKPIFVNAGAGW